MGKNTDQPPVEKNTNEPLDPQSQDYDMSNFAEGGEGFFTSWAKKAGLFIFEIVKVVIISLAIILPIRYFLVQPFTVDGASMEPNFYNREYLVINEISYRLHEPQRGEVVIFKNPENTKVYFIKRVIGLPGEKIEIKKGVVYINSQILPESYLQYFSTTDYPARTLLADEYFLMGDNRPNSHDSRALGPINKKYIIGKVWLRGWPLTRINTFNLPDYSPSN
jgi:signal peptidase I